MTIVAVWYEPGDNAVWAVSDTRISKNGSGATTLTDGAAKILPISVRCFRPAADGFFTAPTFATSLGFAYAGSSLSALMSYTVANTCFQNLIAVGDVSPPSLAQIAEKVRDIGTKYMREVLDRNDRKEGQFECFVFGQCPVEQRFQAFKLTPRLSRVSFDVSVDAAPLADPEYVGLLGGQTAQVQGAIIGARQGGYVTRTPKWVIQGLVASETISGVGGSLQIGIATLSGFRLYSWVHPVVCGKPQAVQTLLGFDVDAEVGAVGAYRVGMVSMV
jgi:hypothetical protein